MTPRRTKKYCDRLIIIYRGWAERWETLARKKNFSIRLINYVTRRIEISLKVRKPVRGRRSRNDLTAVSCIIRGPSPPFPTFTAPRQGLFRVELRAICKVIWYFLSIEATTSCSRRSEGNGDLKNEYERERKEEIMSRTWSNRQDRKCALSTPIIGIYPFPRSFFLLIKPISPRRARKKERETSLLYSYILGIMDRDLEREAWDKASLSLVTPWWNSQFSVQDRSYICKKWGWNVRSGNTHSLRSLERQQRFNKLLKGLLHATHETLNSGGARLRRSSRIDSSQRGRVLRLFSVKGDRYCTVVIHRRLAVTREGHLTRRKGLRRRRIRKRGDKEADDIHRLPTFHSSLVVPFHAKITGLLPHEYV